MWQNDDTASQFNTERPSGSPKCKHLKPEEYNTGFIKKKSLSYYECFQICALMST